MFQNIPSTGIDKWYPLEGRTARSNIQGEIRLRLSLATREDRGIPEDDNWTDVRQHEDLMCIFVEHELHKFSVSSAVRAVSASSSSHFDDCVTVSDPRAVVKWCVLRGSTAVPHSFLVVHAAIKGKLFAARV